MNPDEPLLMKRSSITVIVISSRNVPVKKEKGKNTISFMIISVKVSMEVGSTVTDGRFEAINFRFYEIIHSSVKITLTRTNHIFKSYYL